VDKAGGIGVEITPETAAMLCAHAAAQGLSVDAYLRALLGLGSAENALVDLPEEDLAALMDGFTKGIDHVLPLPTDFSRHDIYQAGFTRVVARR
jgi:hypothetical protein